MGINELLTLKNLLLRTKLETGLKTQANLVLIPKSLKTPLFTSPASEHQVFDEGILGEINPNQKQTQTAAPIAYSNQILDPNIILAEVEKTNHQETISAIDETKKESSEDKSTEKPKVSLGPVLNIALPFSLLPGLLLNVINTAQSGNDTEEHKHKKSQAQENESKAHADNSSDNKQANSLWNSITSIFKPITKPFTQLLDGFTKKVQGFMSLFNNKNKDIEKSSQEANRLEALDHNKQTEETKILQEVIKRQRYIAEQDQRRQEEAIQEARLDAEKATLEKQTKLAEAVQRHEDPAKVPEPVSTKKTPQNELITRLIKQAIAAGIPLDDNLFASNASLSEVLKTIEVLMINDPSAGFVYLTSTGKNLNPIFESMNTSGNSANISRVLNQCLNSASGTFALKSNIDEYLTQQQGRSSIIQA